MESKKERIKYIAYTKNKKFEFFGNSGDLNTDEYNKLSRLKLHRSDGPALIKINNNKADSISELYYLNGLLHRENGPAVIHRQNGVIIYEGYYRNGLIHRENGPAKLSYNINGGVYISKYYFKNTEYSKFEFEKLILLNKISII